MPPPPSFYNKRSNQAWGSAATIRPCLPDMNLNAHEN